jgi:hypothetical protein
MRIVHALLLAALFLPSIVRADPVPSPMLAHVELVEGKQRTDYAVFIAPDGNGGELKVDAPGQLTTKVDLGMRRGPSGPELAFSIEHLSPDKSSYTARGEIALPPPGKKVVVARVPRGESSVEVVVSLTAAR